MRRLVAAETVCTARGARLNGPGRGVLAALLRHERPLKAYELTVQLGSFERPAAPTTVYRALKLLMDVGLAHRIETLNAFVACRFPDEPHLAGFRVCDGCAKVEEVRLEALPLPVRGMERETGRERLVFELILLCPACDASGMNWSRSRA
jgi:Fur family zinc uptake transcriptional regulator